MAGSPGISAQKQQPLPGLSQAQPEAVSPDPLSPGVEIHSFEQRDEGLRLLAAGPVSSLDNRLAACPADALRAPSGAPRLQVPDEPGVLESSEQKLSLWERLRETGRRAWQKGGEIAGDVRDYAAEKWEQHVTPLLEQYVVPVWNRVVVSNCRRLAGFVEEHIFDPVREAVSEIFKKVVSRATELGQRLFEQLTELAETTVEKARELASSAGRQRQDESNEPAGRLIPLDLQVSGAQSPEAGYGSARPQEALYFAAAEKHDPGVIEDLASALEKISEEIRAEAKRDAREDQEEERQIEERQEERKELAAVLATHPGISAGDLPSQSGNMGLARDYTEGELDAIADRLQEQRLKKT